MPLAPEIAASLSERASLGRPPLSEIDLAEARENAEVDGRARPPGRQVRSVSAQAFEGPAGEVPVRVYTPEGYGPFPLIVFLHGGGFVLCSLDTHDAVCRNLAADTPAVVVSVDYRLAPEHTWPAASNDSLAAVRWAASVAEALGADPDRIVVSGDSAGGNLAAVTALRIRDEGGPALAGQLLIYPVTDHAEAGHASYAEYAEGYGLTAADMRWFFEQYVPIAADRIDPLVSPLRAPDLSRLPPAHVMTAEYDVLRDEGEAYAARLAAAGVPVDAVRFEGLNHGSINQLGAWPSVDPAHEAMVRWLRDMFGIESA